MEIIEVPKVFFIKGVFKQTAESIDNLIHLLDDAEVVPIKKLNKFYEPWNDDAWLKQPEVKCATCGCQKQRMVFIPELLETTSKGIKYKCYKWIRFCSWACAAFHILYFLNNDQRYKLNLSLLYSNWTGKPKIEILPGLPPWRLLEYGGDLNIDTYHKLNEYNFDRFISSFEEELCEP